MAGITGALKANRQKSAECQRIWFCFIHAILTCLQEYHGLSLDMEETIDIILEQLVLQPGMYVQWHNATTHSDPYVKNDDILVCDAMEFLNSKNCNMDVVDIIIQNECRLLILFDLH